MFHNKVTTEGKVVKIQWTVLFLAVPIIFLWIQEHLKLKIPLLLLSEEVLIEHAVIPFISSLNYFDPNQSIVSEMRLLPQHSNTSQFCLNRNPGYQTPPPLYLLILAQLSFWSIYCCEIHNVWQEEFNFWLTEDLCNNTTSK